MSEYTFALCLFMRLICCIDKFITEMKFCNIINDVK